MSSNYSSVKIVTGGLDKYQAQHGASRDYPANGVPKLKKAIYTKEEAEIRSKPLLAVAKENSKKTE